MATASEDGTARIWSAKDGRPLTPSLKHDAEVRHIAFSKEGTQVFTASLDGRVRAWNARTGALVWAFAYGENLETLALSRSGNRLAALGGVVVQVLESASGPMRAA